MSTFKTTIDELLVRTQQTQNQKIVTNLIVAKIEELEDRVNELFGEEPESAGWELRKIDRSNWYEIIDIATGAVIEKINGKDNATLYVEELEAKAYPQQTIEIEPPPTADTND